MSLSPSLSGLADELPAPERVALAYAPSAARPAWTGLLVLDARLAGVALGAREPMLAQIRLAWWRDRFRTPAVEWPRGEPLLAVLSAWDSERGALEGLVDGWEAIVAGDPDAAAAARLVTARAEAMAGLARLLGCGDCEPALAAAARAWARRSLPPALAGAAAAATPAGAGPSASRSTPLPRTMRPLAMLAELPREPGAGRRAEGLRTLARIIRLGLIGR